MSAIILGGGRSSRLGEDKISLVIGGENLLIRTVSRLCRLEDDIILVLARGQSEPELPSTPGVRIVTDIFIGKGPLVGIYSGLKASSQDYSIVVACDMPFLSIDLLRYMTSLISNFDIVIPQIGRLVEPLHAVYSKNCLQQIEGMLKKDNLKIDELLDRVRVRYVEENEIDRFDPERLSFFNINTSVDLKRAVELMKREREGVHK